MDTSTLIEAIVAKHISVYGVKKTNKKTYDDFMKDMKDMAKEGLANMDETKVKALIKSFLWDWGTMHRQLGQEKYQDWQRDVTELIKLYSSVLQQFQNKNIEKENLREYKAEIVCLYESFKSATGQIASVKILHLLCSNFFPLWDTAIANALRAELKDSQGVDFDKRIIRFSGGDYFRFMEEVQRFISMHYDIISSLSKRNEQKILRIVDVCFLLMVRRPLYLIFQ